MKKIHTILLSILVSLSISYKAEAGNSGFRGIGKMQKNTVSAQSSRFRMPRLNQLPFFTKIPGWKKIDEFEGKFVKVSTLFTGIVGVVVGGGGIIYAGKRMSEQETGGGDQEVFINRTHPPKNSININTNNDPYIINRTHRPKNSININRNHGHRTRNGNEYDSDASDLDTNVFWGASSTKKDKFRKELKGLFKNELADGATHWFYGNEDYDSDVFEAELFALNNDLDGVLFLKDNGEVDGRVVDKAAKIFKGSDQEDLINTNNDPDIIDLYASSGNNMNNGFGARNGNRYSRAIPDLPNSSDDDDNEREDDTGNRKVAVSDSSMMPDVSNELPKLPQDNLSTSSNKKRLAPINENNSLDVPKFNDDLNQTMKGVIDLNSLNNNLNKANNDDDDKRITSFNSNEVLQTVEDSSSGNQEEDEPQNPNSVSLDIAPKMTFTKDVSSKKNLKKSPNNDDDDDSLLNGLNKDESDLDFDDDEENNDNLRNSLMKEAGEAASVPKAYRVILRILENVVSLADEQVTEILEALKKSPAASDKQIAAVWKEVSDTIEESSKILSLELNDKAELRGHTETEVLNFSSPVDAIDVLKEKVRKKLNKIEKTK